jgi:hypothetical protein
VVNRLVLWERADVAIASGGELSPAYVRRIRNRRMGRKIGGACRGLRRENVYVWKL